MADYISLQNLEVYKLARELSVHGWKIYSSMDWQTKKTIGRQFIESLDSVGANIAEGYGRYHYLDKIKFYYNARASLVESCDHWLSLLCERKLTDTKTSEEMNNLSKNLSLKLNNFINATYKAKGLVS